MHIGPDSPRWKGWSNSVFCRKSGNSNSPYYVRTTATFHMSGLVTSILQCVLIPMLK